MIDTLSSGPTPKDVITQYQGGIVGLPVMQMYWTLGFHQCRWGYENWTVMQEIVDGYANAGIQLETVWNDIDCESLSLILGLQWLAFLRANWSRHEPIP